MEILRSRVNSRRLELWSRRKPPSRQRRARRRLKQSRSLSEVKTEPRRRPEHGLEVFRGRFQLGNRSSQRLEGCRRPLFVARPGAFCTARIQQAERALEPTVVQVAPRVQLKEARVQPEVLRPIVTPRGAPKARAVGPAPLSRTQEQWLQTSRELRELSRQELMPRLKGLQAAPMQTGIG